MPPPAGQTQYSNRIGVGVFVDDGGATVRYLDQVVDRIQRLKALSSATSISIRNTYTGGGPGGGAGVQAEEARVTARRNATQRLVADEARQMTLLDKIDEGVAQKERQRAHTTADYIIGENRRATGVLKASFDYEERLRAQHVAKVKTMALEQLRAADIRAGGRDEAVTEELVRRKEAIGRRVAHPETKWHEFTAIDPEGGRRYQQRGLRSREEEYASTRQAIAGRTDLQKYLPYVDAQIEAHRKGLYTGPIGDIPREGGDTTFRLPPEGHPHRGPGTEPVSRERPTMQAAHRFEDASTVEAAAQEQAAEVARKHAKWQAQKLEREQKQAFYEESSSLGHLPPREIEARKQDFINAEAHELAARQELNEAVKGRAKAIREAGRTRAGVPTDEDLSSQMRHQLAIAEGQRERVVEESTRERAQRSRFSKVIRQTEGEEYEEKVREAGVAAYQRGYLTPEQQAFREQKNRRDYEARREAFQARVSRLRREQRLSAAGQGQFQQERPEATTVRGLMSEFERLSPAEADARREEFEARMRQIQGHPTPTSSGPTAAPRPTTPDYQERGYGVRPRVNLADADARADARGPIGPRPPIVPPVGPDDLTDRSIVNARRVGPIPPKEPDEGDRGVFGTRRTRPTLEGTEREIVAVANAANTLTRDLNKVEKAAHASLDMRSEATKAKAGLQGVNAAATQLQQQLHKPAGERPPYKDVLTRLEQLKGEINSTRAQAAKLNNQLLNTPGGAPNNPPGGGGGPGGGGRRQTLFQRGLFGVGGGGAGGITASILTSMFIRGAMQDTLKFTQLSLEAVDAEANASAELAIASRNAHRLTQDNVRLAQSIGRVSGLNEAVAEETVASGQRFAERAGMTAKTQQLTQALVDLAAARRIPQKSLPEFLNQAQNEEGRFAEKYLGKRVQTIYEEYALQNKDRLSRGLKYEAQTEDPFSKGLVSTRLNLQQLTSTLTDYEREQALANEILRQSAQYGGAAAQRASSLAGQMDVTRNAVNAIEVAFGRFLQTNRLIVGVMRTAADLMESFADSVDKLPSKPGALFLSDADINERANKVAQFGGTRALELGAHVTGGTLDLIVGATIAGLRGDTEGVKNLSESYADVFTNEPAKRASEQLRQQLLRERNDAFREAVEAGRVELVKGEALDIGAGKGLKVVDEKEAAKKRDAALQRDNDERRERERIFERQRLALGRVSEFIERQGGPETAQRVAGLLAPDNRYTQILSDLDSAATRMQLQWGVLGQDTVDYFTKLEEESGRAQLAVQRVNSLTEALKLQTQAISERDRLELSTDLTRSESARVDTLRAQVDLAMKLPELEGRRQRVLRVGPGLLGNPEFLAREQLSQLSTLGGPGVGFGYEGRAGKRVINEAVLSLLQQIPDSVIENTPYMRDAFSRAIEGQQSELRQAVFDAFNAETLIGRENDRLVQTARGFDDARAALLQSTAGELEKRQLGRAFDRGLIQQTEGVSPRELAQLGLFDVRNQAIQREAQRAVEEESEARRATIEGLNVQRGILLVATRIAEALQAGDMSLLVQVENAIGANIRAENLKPTQDLTPVGGPPNYAADMYNQYGRGRSRE